MSVSYQKYSDCDYLFSVRQPVELVEPWHQNDLLVFKTEFRNVLIEIMEKKSVLIQGYQIWAQSGSDWPQMGQIRNFFRSDF